MKKFKNEGTVLKEFPVSDELRKELDKELKRRPKADKEKFSWIKNIFKESKK